MDARESDFDTDVIPNLPTSLITIGEFQAKKWAISIFDSILIGVLGGFASIGFIYLMNFFSWFFSDFLLNGLAIRIGGWNLTVILMPALGGIIIGPLLMKYAPEATGEGVPEIIEAVALKEVIIRKRVGFFKAIGSALTIGTGGSAGREGPIAQIGASVGSTIGQIFHLDKARRRHLVVCGCAAGIAGIFGAPFGGAFFALEVLSETIVVLDAVPVFISAAIGSAMTSWMRGGVPVFLGAATGSFSGNEYAILGLFGIIFGFLAVGWVTFFRKMHGVMNRVKLPPKYKPILGGLLTGIVGIFFVGEGVLGLGHEGLEGALLGEFSLQMFLLLALAKMAATSFTLGSGGSGGLFTPTLFIGAMFGGAFGLIVEILFPGMIANPRLYTIIGMGAFFAGASQCPINIILMIPELTGNYDIIFPVIITSMLSYMVFRLLMKGSSIYTVKLERRGVALKAGGRINLESFKIADLIIKEVPILSPTQSVAQLEELDCKYKLHFYPVAAEGQFLGIVSTRRVLEVPSAARKETLVKAIMRDKFLTMTPEKSVQVALDAMLKNGLDAIFVVANDNPNNLVGIVTIAEILRIGRKFVKDGGVSS